MRTVFFECVMVAESSIHHNGGKKLGVTSLMRREIVVQPDGTPEQVPVISGNSLRKKIIRLSGMHQMLRMLGYSVDSDEFLKAVGAVGDQQVFEDTFLGQHEAQLDESAKRAVKRAGLTLPAFHFLFGGGALTKEGGEGIDIEFARYLRRLVPLVGVLGGAIGGVILPGKLKPLKAVPLVEETAHILPARFMPASPQTIYSYLQREMYTRKDEAKNENLRGFLADDNLQKLIGQPELLPVGKSDKPVKTVPQQMRYWIETIAAGVRFHWGMYIEEPTAMELEAVQLAMAEFEKSPFIGAMSRAGHGKVRFEQGVWRDLSTEAKIEATITLEGREINVPITGKYQKHLESKTAEIRDYLAGMK